jgi:hypothetical protein
MSWHILRKDLVLLWPLVALSCLAQFGLDAVMLAADRTPESHGLPSVARLFVLVVFLAIALTISQAVHQFHARRDSRAAGASLAVRDMAVPSL